MKYPLKAHMPLDRDGKLPSDEAWERVQKLIAKAMIRIQSKQSESKGA